MLLKKGSKGNEVKELQKFLGLTADGVFGPQTEEAVKKWQWENGLERDGIVGPETSKYMGLSSTDLSEKFYTTSNGLQVEQYYLPYGEYIDEITEKEYVFLHHTAGWHKPKNVIDSWGRDSRGKVATEFVLGGPSVKGDDNSYDGEMIQCFPEGCYGWHLGKNGSHYMHKHSIGIEVCNFGWIKDGKTYAGTTAHESQIVKLSKPFRGYEYWHKYSDKQIEAIRLWLLWIAERDSIDIRKGLIEEIKDKGVDGFEFNEDAYYGRIKGLWTHTNVRKDKVDMFPQQELIDMLLSL